MNIYKRQMNELGLNIDQYSNMIDVPKSIVNKMVNGNGEVVENNMEINNFLRKNLFGKHQEIENNMEEKKVEAIGIKLERGSNSDENKKQWLLAKYPDSKEVNWYINEYDKDTYYEKYNVSNKVDLMRRYNFTCKKGKLKNKKEVGTSTIDRLINKEYSKLGKESAYELICQLYDCFVNGNISMTVNYRRHYNTTSKNFVKGKKGFQQIEYTEEEQKLRDWFYSFDFKEFAKRKGVSTYEMAKDLKVSETTVKAIKKGTYRPSMKLVNKLYEYVYGYKADNDENNLRKWFMNFDIEKFCADNFMTEKKFAQQVGINENSIHSIKIKRYIPNEDTLRKMKEFVESYESNFATKTVTGSAKVFDIPVDENYLKEIEDKYNNFVAINHEEPKIEPLYNDSEEILRNLLKDRLTEEEKTLILLFHGNLD